MPPLTAGFKETEVLGEKKDGGLDLLAFPWAVGSQCRAFSPWLPQEAGGDLPTQPVNSRGAPRVGFDFFFWS